MNVNFSDFHPQASVLNISKLNSIYYFALDKDYYFEGERHDLWELVYVDKGEVMITAENKTHLLTTGEMRFHQPNEFHNIFGNKRVDSNIFIMSFVSKSASMKFFRNKIIKIPDYLTKYIVSIISEATKKTSMVEISFVPSLKSVGYNLIYHHNFHFGGLQLIRLYLTQFLILLMRDEEGQKNTNLFYLSEHYDNVLLGELMLFLNQNIYKKLTLTMISDAMHFSVTHISEVFKKHIGMTIIHYYNRLKINEAKKLIRENHHNLSEIAELLCFDNQNYFTKVFKREEGIPPREYAKIVEKVF